MEKARTSTPPEIEITEAENPQKTEEPISISLPIPFPSNKSRSSFEESSASSLSSSSEEDNNILSSHSKKEERFLTPIEPLPRKSSESELQDVLSISIAPKYKARRTPSKELEECKNPGDLKVGIRDRMKKSLQISSFGTALRPNPRSFSCTSVIDNRLNSQIKERLEEAQLTTYADFDGLFDKKYETKEIRGEGTMGLVKRCIRRASAENFAVKIVRTSDIELLQVVKNEFDLQQKLNHPTIVKVEEMFFDPIRSRVSIIMELVDGSELFDKIIETGALDEVTSAKLFKQLLSAIDYLHKNGVCHRDLKPHNVLINGDMSQVKLTDFNVSKLCSQQHESGNERKKFLLNMHTNTGTLAYSAPEMLQSNEYNEAVDIWSAGTILYTMLSGCPPFESENTAKLIEKIVTGSYTLKDGPWDFITESAKDLIEKMMALEPDNRITASESLMHPWIVANVENGVKKRDTWHGGNISLPENLMGMHLERTNSLRVINSNTKIQRRMSRFEFQLKNVLESVIEDEELQYKITS